MKKLTQGGWKVKGRVTSLEAQVKATRKEAREEYPERREQVV
jgi:hypothetical protein